MRRTVLFAALAFAFVTSGAYAQEQRVYVGGSLGLFTQTHPDAVEPLGGTTLSASALIGTWLSSHIAIEAEPTFAAAFSQEYSYPPIPDQTFQADVVASRRDSYFPVQIRLRVSKLEPVFGGGLRHGKEREVATFRGEPYFDNSRSDNGFFVTVGLDVPVAVSPRVSLLPSFRLLTSTGKNSEPEFGVAQQTQTGAVAMRLGVGARVSF